MFQYFLLEQETQVDCPICLSSVAKYYILCCLVKHINTQIQCSSLDIWFCISISACMFFDDWFWHKYKRSKPITFWGFLHWWSLVINIVSCKKPHKIEEKHHIFNAGWQKKWNSGWETLIFKLQFAVHIWPSHPNQHRVQILFCCAARDHCTMAVVKRWHFRERTVGISAVMCRTHLGRCSNNCS